MTPLQTALTDKAGAGYPGINTGLTTESQNSEARQNYSRSRSKIITQSKNTGEIRQNDKWGENNKNKKKKTNSP